MRVCVIFNPTAKGDQARRLRRYLETMAAATVLRPTQAPGQARRLAAEAVADDFRTIVAAGGDGTVNEVVNGIADTPDGLRRVQVGVLPLGTVNVFARELGLPNSVTRAWRIIQRGRERKIDLPWVEFMGMRGPERRCFAELAGAGLDARAVDLVNWELKKRIGLLAYLVAVLRALGERQPLINLRAGPERAAGQLVLVGNGRYYGGPFPAFPAGNLGDGRLGILVLPRANWGAVVRCGAALLAGRLDRMRSVRHLRAETFELGSDAPVRLEVDGETVGNLPATFSLQPRSLRVLAPAGPGH